MTKKEAIKYIMENDCHNYCGKCPFQLFKKDIELSCTNPTNLKNTFKIFGLSYEKYRYSESFNCDRSKLFKFFRSNIKTNILNLG